MARFLSVKTTGMYRLNFDALDGDVMKLSFAEPIPEPFHLPMRTLKPRSNYGGGAPVSPEHFPTRLQLSGRDVRIVDFNDAYHMYLVNQRFIDVVKRFQTAIQYLPVECVWKDGTPAGQYFFFFTTVMLDAVVREKTTANWVQLLPDKGIWQPDLYGGQTFTFDMSRLDGAHMWVDPNMPYEGALVSDALYAALREAEIQSFYEYPNFAEI